MPNEKPVELVNGVLVIIQDRKYIVEGFGPFIVSSMFGHYRADLHLKEVE